MSARYESIIRAYGEEGFARIQAAKILVVGAGGIGCEILKNLALSGFKTIELIDLDTIDVSNLNRQFLFRPEHVGQPKAVIAAKAATAFNPDMKVVSYHDNIKSSNFNLAYFEKFNLVLNALDNIDARRHVNRLCLAANIPLIDSGTTGYLGQVMPIIKGMTSCYECFPKPTQKVYPICTIRSTPDKPVHCIVWAKECFKLLFNQPSESMLFEDASSGETSTYMHLIKFPSDLSVDSILTFGGQLVLALFNTEIDKRLKMDVYKTAKVVPAPLGESDISAAVEECRAVLTGAQAPLTKASGWDQKVFTLQENLVQFLTCLYEVAQKDYALLGQLSFDKDDLWAMKFVTAASNLRSFVFTIPLLSFHDAKGVAGNIIPAIATTNAIVAGIQVMQAVRLITQPEALQAAAGESAEAQQQRVQRLCPHTYCLRLPTRKGTLLQPSQAEGPLPACYVCGASEITLQIDVHKTTLGELVTRILKNKLGFNAPSITLGSSGLYEEGEGADEDLVQNLPKLLAQCPAGGVVDGALLVIEDFTQELEVRLVVKHVSNEELALIPSAAEDLFIIGGRDAFEKRQLQQQATAAAAASAGQDGAAVPEEDDGFLVLDDVDVTLSSTTTASLNKDPESVHGTTTGTTSSSAPAGALRGVSSDSVSAAAGGSAGGAAAGAGATLSKRSISDVHIHDSSDEDAGKKLRVG